MASSIIIFLQPERSSVLYFMKGCEIICRVFRYKANTESDVSNAM